MFLSCAREDASRVKESRVWGVLVSTSIASQPAIAIRDGETGPLIAYFNSVEETGGLEKAKVYRQ